ncbi:G5P family DNA-binding protein [Luteimonas sp. S4-F44]|uniref:G5P family DNA-binding protein n=1 Tax=Luteimonas sp. S4-F44 TaxID=2925842 RepID=UPI001F52EC11|nr:G5P family DNA-binding protein [Luteimonas sp. S4-F44]UNK44018.1 G5P family DNA-binding protein [Luteimonas sp. S4-F44]
MSHIIVKSDAVLTRTIPARGDRKEIHFREQKAAIDSGEDFPLPFNVQLDDDQRPYPPGLYQLDLASVEVNEYGGLKFGRRVRLVGPLDPPKKA